MQKINSNLFPFSFFLSDRKKVNTLEEGARIYGGATQYNNGIFSNYEGDSNIRINKTNNTISLFVPSTIDVNKKADNTEIIQYIVKQLKQEYNTDNIIFYDTKGSWYSDSLNQVVIEDVTIISVDLATVTEKDINLFIKLSNYIKQKMSQEGVSIAINTALAIV